MGWELLEIYSDYLLYSNGQTTATGLSKLLEGKISHDKITRLLSSESYDEKTLWKKAKKIVRAFEEIDACLIFDDSIAEKPYMDENDIICWHYDHKENRLVKGINLLSAFYHSEKGIERIRIPVGFRVIEKTEEYFDEKSGKMKRRSPITKNEMMQEMIKMQIRNQVKFTYILADSWFSSAENMKFIDKNGKVFIFELKENRLIAFSEEQKEAGKFERLDEAKVSEGNPVKVWIKDLKFPVMLFKQVFTNKDGSHGQRYLVSNELTLTDEQFRTLYKKRWGVEEYHKSLKQNASIESSPAHTKRTQSNHIFASIYAYIKLEILRLSTKFNHFMIKGKMYMAATKTAMAVYRELWESAKNYDFA